MTELRREIGLWRGVALNMIDMIGIGPFITIPLILSAMGGTRCMLAWLLAGLLAISDGLVTAELAAEMPKSGGSYVFLRESYGKAGKLISFLFLFQMLFSAPLSIASGCLGFAHYLAVLAPPVGDHIKVTAVVVCAGIVLLLMRRIDTIGRLSILFWAGVLLTVAVVIGVGLPHLKLSTFTFWNAPRFDGKEGYEGLGAALIIAVYDYLGYYNIAHLGDEVKQPERNIPRAIVISIVAIGIIYTVMNACIVSVLPMKTAMSSPSVVGDYMRTLFGTGAARWVSILIMWTGFASVFSVMLGYSRILFAAGRDGNFFRIFGHLHQRNAYPVFAVVCLGVLASLFCLFPLKEVVQGVVLIKAVVPFMAQIVGAIILRVRQPERRRPFRMWLYPLPAIVALGLWSYVVVSPEKRPGMAAVYVILAGMIFFGLRELFLRVTTTPRAA